MSDRTKNDLHKTGCRRYRDINKEASPGTAAGADLNFCTPRAASRLIPRARGERVSGVAADAVAVAP